MKKKFLYITTFVCGLLGATACDDMLDTEALSTDNLEYLCSNPTDARKMVAHVYSYMCEDTYTSRMSTNWMQNTDIVAEINVSLLTSAGYSNPLGILIF